ncbi:hypothetical protein B0J13DRAFT_523320 [Dactylonectria estremocensis]|uniref:Uncharacterized protein n=1 Tax=Dactylonectria estremocensis TaxID=1079267 RepID=A0A9P9JBP9_9HYPO|nr:hypothetical protein B0J13DRAFT_523320 [Dactylonectria estremocensis]
MSHRQPWMHVFLGTSRAGATWQASQAASYGRQRTQKPGARVSLAWDRDRDRGQIWDGPTTTPQDFRCRRSISAGRLGCETKTARRAKRTHAKRHGNAMRSMMKRRAFGAFIFSGGHRDAASAKTSKKPRWLGSAFRPWHHLGFD